MADFAAWIGVAAGLASIAGLIVAFVQLRAVSSRAKTASDTAQAVQRLLASRSVLYEVTMCSQAASDARSYLRLGLAPSALNRVEGLASRLNTIRRLEWFSEDERAKALRTALASVALVRQSLDDLMSEDSRVLPSGERREHMKRLGKTEDQLHEWIGELRHVQEEKQT